VFDASCHTSLQNCLNDLLLLIFKFRFQFRINRKANTADVVKIFRQVLVDKRNRRFQQILWRRSPLEPLNEEPQMALQLQGLYRWLRSKNRNLGHDLVTSTLSLKWNIPFLSAFAEKLR